MAEEKKEAGKPGRVWEFTIHGDQEARDKAWAWLTTELVDGVNRLACAKEVGEGGTPHIQGRIHFGANKRLSALKKLHATAHWERSKATADWSYYMKSDSEEVFHQDNRKGQGARTDLKVVYDLAKEGKLNTIAAEHTETYLKYHAAIGRIANLRDYDTSPRRFKSEVYWLYGLTGVGKTRAIFSREADADERGDIWWSSESCKSFFNGFCSHPIVVFNDFRPDQLNFSTMLRLTDRYPMKVNVKYGSAEWNPKRIYFTAPFHPKEMFGQMSGEGEIQQLRRRITKVIEVKMDEEVVWD